MNVLGFLAHTVMVCAEGGNIELLLNRITSSGITPKEVMPTKTGVVFYIPARHFKILRRLKKGTGTRIFLLSKSGPLFLFKRILRRKSLPIAVALFFICLYLLSGIVWRIDTGALSEENSAAIKTLLFAEGIYPGSIANSEKFRLAEQSILIKSETFSYLKLNFAGGRLEVSAQLPQNYLMIDEDTRQIVAAFDGIIRFIEVYEGYSMVKINQSVSEGQLLVDNIKINIDNEIIPSTVYANIIGYGEAVYSHEEPMNFSADILTNDTDILYAFHLLDARIPLYFDSKFDENYHRQTILKPVTLFGLKLPITIEKTILTKTLSQTISITEDEALYKADRYIEHQLYEDYNFPNILEKKVEVSTKNNVVYVKIKYTFLANIIKNN